MISAEVNYNFKNSLVKSILAIVLFIISYIALFFFAIGVCVLFALGGIALFIAHPGFLTILIGLGLIGSGLMVFFYLIKFLFSKNESDNSHLLEVKKTEEPQLFNLIEEVVQGVGTDFPNKIYLSADVNASVFYDSGFWSMFLPVKKNLQIGVGLLNTVTESEIKAILAHEFGHFAQESMKVGSYVFYVNRIIYNLLFENEGFKNFFSSIGQAHGIIFVLLKIAELILNLIQWILKELYSLVNKSFLSLSREMEFQADEVAVKFTETDALKMALLRISLADFALNEVFRYYENKISSHITSSGIFQEQLFLMKLMAVKNELPLEGELPKVSIDTINKFNKSKLIVKDQWASHPPIEERIERMTPFIKKETGNNQKPARDVLTNFKDTEQKLTKFLFSKVNYSKETSSQSLQSFIDEVNAEYEKNTLPKIYNGYYDFKIPVSFDLNKVPSNSKVSNVSELFSNEKIEWVNQLICLTSDINSLIQISENKDIAPTFDYNGVKYNHIDSFDLYPKLQNEERELAEKLKENDIEIYNFFKQKEERLNNKKELKSLYKQLFSFETKSRDYSDLLFNIQNNLSFVSESLPYEDIQTRFKNLIHLEDKLKDFFKLSSSNNHFDFSLNNVDKDLLYFYMNNQLSYFSEDSYKEDQLEKLFAVISIAHSLLNAAFFYYKKQILLYQESLIAENI